MYMTDTHQTMNWAVRADFTGVHVDVTSVPRGPSVK